jgi:hypothetical protein
VAIVGLLIADGALTATELRDLARFTNAPVKSYAGNPIGLLEPISLNAAPPSQDRRSVGVSLDRGD